MDLEGGIGANFLPDFCGGFGMLVLDALEVFEDAGSAFGDEQGLDVVALFARELADFGGADGEHRQVLIDRQRLQFFGGEAVAHI